ncbi:MAG: hypothetical protein JNL01_15910 [Bdellovibrionales bacterium]|nr:hypothetical protein [Bdellovibrionales bacterium]
MSNATSLPKTHRLKITPTETQVFMFSAVTWNRHQIHFDLNQAKKEGFPAVAVQRGLLGNFLARMVTEWAGNQGRLERLQWKVLQSAFPGQELECIGQIKETGSSVNPGRVILEVRILNSEDAVIASGEAVVQLHER